MSRISRRSLAQFAADQLLAGKPASAVAKKLAAELVESNRAGELEFLCGDIAAELENRGELAVANVTAANELTPELRQALTLQVKKATGVKEVILNEQVDKSVLGGARIETSGHIWDHTLARKLSLLKEAF